MPALTDVIDPILARFEGCPRALAIEALLYSAIEFCKETMFLTTGTEVTLDGTETPTFDLDPQVIDIFQADIEDKDVMVTHLNDPNAQSDTLADAGYDYAIRYASDTNNIELTAAEGQAEPSVSAPITIRLVLAIAPGPTATELHEDLWRRYSEELRWGAYARLFAEPKKLWTDMQLAMFYENKFTAAKTAAAFSAGANRVMPAQALRVKSVF